MIYIIFLLFFLFSIRYYFVLFLNIASYILALITYLIVSKFRIISNNNLNLIFSNYSFIQKQIIIINSYKNFIFNIIIVLLQYLFRDSFLYKYYNKKSYKIYNKIQLVLCHFGLFYDPSSSIYMFNKKIASIYKGNFDFYINKNIKMFQHNKINFNELYRYDIIATPIDQKSVDLPKVYFLKQETKFP
jgi:hypothetical protein